MIHQIRHRRSFDSWLLFIILVLATPPAAFADDKPKPENPPNLIFIMADDLGYADVGFNGQAHFATPNLDRMAAEGMNFRQFYAGSTVCAPSRACLLTGQHTGHVYQRYNGKVQFREDDQDITIARMLKQRGYATAMIGKSGLACNSTDAGLPNRKGFDYFYGYLAHAAAHRYYPRVLWENGKQVKFPGNQGKNGDTYSGDLFLNRSLDWIRDNQKRPFFLHVSLQQPHADLAAPARFRDKYIGQFEEKPYAKGGHYRAQSHPKATFIAMVEYLDWSIGQILDQLVDLGLDKNTYVFFSSDNGPHFEGGAHPDYFDSNGPFRGGKRDLYEGGIRVPFVVWAPGRIQAGSTSDHIGAFWDFPATACELSGQPMNDDSKGDGISFAPTLHGNAVQAEHKYLYWEFYEQGGRQAVRMGDWKAVRLNVNKDPNSKFELYDLNNDPGETTNVATDHPDLIQKLNSFAQKAHRPHPNKSFGDEKRDPKPDPSKSKR